MNMFTIAATRNRSSLDTRCDNDLVPTRAQSHVLKCFLDEEYGERFVIVRFSHIRPEWISGGLSEIQARTALTEFGFTENETADLIQRARKNKQAKPANSREFKQHLAELFARKRHEESEAERAVKKPPASEERTPKVRRTRTK
jgi:hypothetical protein